MARKKGRKIYTYRARNRRMFGKHHPFRSAMGIAVTVLLAAVLGIVGYSVIGPVVTRLNAEAESPTKTDDPYFESHAEPASTPDSAEESREETAPQISTTAKTETQTTASETETTASETTTEAVSSYEPRFGGVQLSYAVSQQTASDLKLLGTAAERAAAQGYTALYLPMKLAGGKLAYASQVADAVKCGASAESPTLAELTQTAAQYGLALTASVNALDDTLFPAQFADGAYQLKDNRGRWHDRAKSDGGKPWISPFTDRAKRYLSQIAAELTAGGVEGIVLDGIVFPRFRNSDVELLGKQVTDEKARKTALTGLYAKVADSCAQLSIFCTLEEALKGGTEALNADLPDGAALCISVDVSAQKSNLSFGGKSYALRGKSLSERAETLLGLMQAIAGEHPVCPCFIRNGLSDADLDLLLTAANDAGCKSVIVTD